MSDDPIKVTPPTRIGPYEIAIDADGKLIELGRGNMGVTYLARDPSLDREVALKVIRAESVASEPARERFRREARAAARLLHPNVAMVFQLGEADGAYFYAMEFVRGEDLDTIVRRDGPLPCRRVLRIAKEVASALSASHAAGLVHRDIKPANLMSTHGDSQDSLTKVIDFGLAKAISPGGAADPALLTNGFVGTVHFASPEQIEGRESDIRADLYSLGATLWYLLTGQTIFQGSIPRVLYCQIHEQPPFERLRAPEEIIALLRWLLAKEVTVRPQTPAELLERLLKIEGTIAPDSRCELIGAPNDKVMRFTVHDVLRSHHLLALTDAMPLLEGIAKAIEGEWSAVAGAFNLRLNAMLIEIEKRDRVRTAEEILRKPVRDWPAFTIVVPRIEIAAPAATSASFAERTIEECFPVEMTKTSVPALARIAYELLGGNLDRLKTDPVELAPLAALDEAGNGVIRRGMADRDGSAFPSAQIFFAALLVSSPEHRARAARRPEAVRAGSDASLPLPSRRFGRFAWAIAAGILCIAAITAFILRDRESGRGADGATAPIEASTPNAVPDRASSTTQNLIRASAAEPFTNGIGMSFIPVSIGADAGRTILFAQTETTVAQYAAFAAATSRSVEPSAFPQGDDHPAVDVSWEDAAAFCAWLTEAEQAAGRLLSPARYRLPSDREWSYAAEIGGRENADATPKDAGGVVAGVYPWGVAWPPPPRSGNYADAAALSAGTTQVALEGYDDGFAQTCPVRTFPANALGLYGIGGNASEWCEDWYDPKKQISRTLRGACWRDSDEFYLRSSFRGNFDPRSRFAGYGFRVVLDVPTQP